MFAPTTVFPTSTEATTPERTARKQRTWTITEHTEGQPVVHRNVSQRDALVHLDAMLHGAHLPRPVAQADRRAA